MKQCPFCGRMLSDNARFCTGCGKRVTQPAPASDRKPGPGRQPQAEERCPACGAELPANVKFCTQCGAKLSNSFRNMEELGGQKLSEQGGKGDVPRWLFPAGVALAALLAVAVGVGIVFLTTGWPYAAEPEATEISSDETEPETLEEPEEDAETVAQTEPSESPEEDAAPSITLSVSSLYLENGEMASITAQAEGGTVTWTVEDVSILSLAASGETAAVTALGVGSTAVVAECGGASARCIVTVYQSDVVTSEEDETEAEDSGALDSADEYLLPTDTRVIAESELYGMTREEVALARNEIYARHGHIFTTPEYAEYFESKSWYTPDPNFDSLDASQLSEIELENIDVIVNYEERMGWR